MGAKRKWDKPGTKEVTLATPLLGHFTLSQSFVDSSSYGQTLPFGS